MAEPTTSNADGWYAVFNLGSRAVRLPVAFFLSYEDEAKVFKHEAIVFDGRPGQKTLRDAMGVAQFEDLVYEPDVSAAADRKVDIAKVREFLRGVGATDAVKQTREFMNQAMMDELARMYARELLEQRGFVTKDSF